MTTVLIPEDFRALAEPLRLEVHVGDSIVPVELAVESVDDLPTHRLRNAPFSLVLRGPSSPALPQATYTLGHPSLGAIEVFLVPIAEDATSRRYEATFN